MDPVIKKNKPLLKINHFLHYSARKQWRKFISN